MARGKRLRPIEVKLPGRKSRKSFDCFIEKHDVKAGERFIVYTKNLAREGSLTYLPCCHVPYRTRKYQLERKLSEAKEVNGSK